MNYIKNDKNDSITISKLNLSYDLYPNESKYDFKLSQDKIKLKYFFDEYFYKNYEIWTKTVWRSDSKLTIIGGKSKTYDLVMFFIYDSQKDRLFPLSQWGSEIEKHIEIDFPIYHLYNFIFCISRVCHG